MAAQSGGSRATAATSERHAARVAFQNVSDPIVEYSRLTLGLPSRGTCAQMLQFCAGSVAERALSSRHERALARVASGGPHDFASAVLRVDQYYCLSRQSLRRGSSPSGEIAPKDICQVGAGLGGKRAPEKIYAPARVTRWITRVSPEFRGAEVPRSAPPGRERPVVILGIEGPDVEVLDAVALIHIVQGSALAQGTTQEAADVPAGTLRISPEQFRLCVCSQRGESKQVSYFDPRQRPIRIPGHAAILSRRVQIRPMTQRVACGR
jgi:hypothetical protein